MGHGFKGQAPAAGPQQASKLLRQRGHWRIASARLAERWGNEVLRSQAVTRFRAFDGLLAAPSGAAADRGSVVVDAATRGLSGLRSAIKPLGNWDRVVFRVVGSCTPQAT